MKIKSKISRLTRVRWFILGLVDPIPDRLLVALGFCPYCLHHSITVTKRPTQTAYVDEDRNRDIVCCFEEHDAEWSARWAEYYAGCL